MDRDGRGKGEGKQMEGSGKGEATEREGSGKGEGWERAGRGKREGREVEVRGKREGRQKERRGNEEGRENACPDLAAVHCDLLPASRALALVEQLIVEDVVTVHLTLIWTLSYTQ